MASAKLVLTHNRNTKRYTTTCACFCDNQYTSSIILPACSDHTRFRHIQAMAFTLYALCISQNFSNSIDVYMTIFRYHMAHHRNTKKSSHFRFTKLSSLPQKPSNTISRYFQWLFQTFCKLINIFSRPYSHFWTNFSRRFPDNSVVIFILCCGDNVRYYQSPYIC